MGPFYDRDGDPISLKQWSERFDEDQHVAITVVDDIALISTVWLGVFLGDGPPLIYETMVFNGPLNNARERYATEEAAQAGHERWVAAVRHASIGD